MQSLISEDALVPASMQALPVRMVSSTGLR
jgi:hypothetical protein